MNAPRSYTTRKAAATAARRALRAIHGPRYLPKSHVDFVLTQCRASLEWRFEIINEAGHRADAERNATERAANDIRTKADAMRPGEWKASCPRCGSNLGEVPSAPDSPSQVICGTCGARTPHATKTVE